MNQTPWLVLTCDEGSVDLAEAELLQAAPKARVVATLDEGVLLVSAGAPAADLAAAWETKPPIFVRHICPVQHIVVLEGAPEDVSTLVAALNVGAPQSGILSEFAAETSFSVQTRLLSETPYKPFDVNQALAAEIQTSTDAPLDVRNPTQIFSVVIANMLPDLFKDLHRIIVRVPNSGVQGSRSALLTVAFLGLSPASANLSNWAGGMRRFAREDGQISRAEFKLLEAIDVFGLSLPPRGVALDLGAAPGGWTRVLRNLDQYVTAVDPGALDPRLSSDKWVRHKRMTAEVYLRDEPDTFDIIVNDMRMDARDSARLMVTYAKQLQPHGVAVMTLKLPETGRARVIEHAFSLLRQAYRIEGARQLFHNRSEITVILRPLSRS
ncbi:MAG: 50S rRNA methyltransferase [Anaerolineales bacterium]|nr:50S rRNA methyltransferase [Anaerolineales bacterium]